MKKNYEEISNRVIRGKVFSIAKNLKYDRYHIRGLASMVYKFFDKENSGGAVRNKIISNKELAPEKKRKLH